MYNAIREHPSVRTLYGRKLAEAGVVTPEKIEQLAEGYRNALDEGRNPNQAALGMIGNQYTVDWSRYHQASLGDSIATGLPEAELARLETIVNTVPADLKLHSRVQRIVEDRRRMAAGETGIDWASPRRSPTRRCSPRTFTCASSVRTAGAARSSIGTRRSSTRTRVRRSYRSRTSRPIRVRSRSRTRCCRRRPCSASSTATAPRRPTRS